MKVKSLSRVRLLATPWTAAHQAPPSMGFSRQEYWNGVPLPSPTFTIDVIKGWSQKRAGTVGGELPFAISKEAGLKNLLDSTRPPREDARAASSTTQ